MLDLRQMRQEVLATGRVDSHHLEAMRRAFPVNGKIDRQNADFLVELHKRVQHTNPAFEQFFYQAIKRHVLTDGRIGSEETAWLRQALFADPKIKDEARKLLHELKGEAAETSRKFAAMFAECMKQPPEAHTCGGRKT